MDTTLVHRKVRQGRELRWCHGLDLGEVGERQVAAVTARYVCGPDVLDIVRLHVCDAVHGLLDGDLQLQYNIISSLMHTCFDVDVLYCSGSSPRSDSVMAGLSERTSWSTS